MIGHIGSGKSSFANTLKTVSEDTGEICNPAATYGTHMGSGTKRVKEISVKISHLKKDMTLFSYNFIFINITAS